jgi:hypothetical protein
VAARRGSQEAGSPARPVLPEVAQRARLASEEMGRPGHLALPEAGRPAAVVRSQARADQPLAPQDRLVSRVRRPDAADRGLPDQA